jgi:AcrR family transcriptional regulator
VPDTDNHQRPRRLPPGRHGLPRSFVVHDQRSRLLAATAEAAAEKGFVAMSVEDVVQRSGVSRRTFYEHFADKRDAFFAAYDESAQQAVEAVLASFAQGSDWLTGTRHGLRAFLDFSADRPHFSRIGYLEMDFAGPEGRRRRREAMARFEALLQPAFAMAGHPVPAAITTAISGAIHELVQRKVAADDYEGIRQLLPVVVFLVVAPFLGGEAAAREAQLAEAMLD